LFGLVSALGKVLVRLAGNGRYNLQLRELWMVADADADLRVWVREGFQLPRHHDHARSIFSSRMLMDPIRPAIEPVHFTKMPASLSDPTNRPLPGSFRYADEVYHLKSVWLIACVSRWPGSVVVSDKRMVIMLKWIRPIVGSTGSYPRRR
jgi:hypothetical protein